jgi:hypothetical protein
MNSKILAWLKVQRLIIGPAITLLLFSSCSSHHNQNMVKSNSVPVTKNAIIKKPGSSYNDTITVKANTAVFYSPDSLQLVKIKEVNQINIFDMITHDCHFQMLNARKVLKENWPKIKIIDAQKARYVVFVKDDQSKVIVDLDQKNDICGLLLFDGKKNPVLADMPNIETVLTLYFK